MEPAGKSDCSCRGAILRHQNTELARTHQAVTRPVQGLQSAHRGGMMKPRRFFLASRRCAMNRSLLKGFRKRMLSHLRPSGSQLGAGAFGEVTLHNEGGKPWALKRTPRTSTAPADAGSCRDRTAGIGNVTVNLSRVTLFGTRWPCRTTQG